MDYYEMRWNERKRLLISSSIIGSIAALLLIVWGVVTMGFSSITEVFQAAVALVFLALLFTAIIVIVRMIKNGTGEGFAINMLNGFWMVVINSFSASMIGMVIGLFMMVVFFWLFLIVAAIYAMYFPISTIYFYVKYKKEVASKESVSPSDLKEI